MPTVAIFVPMRYGKGRALSTSIVYYSKTINDLLMASRLYRSMNGYNRGIRLCILKDRAFLRMRHNVADPKLRVFVSSASDDIFSALLLSVLFSFTATCVALSLLLFIIKFFSKQTRCVPNNCKALKKVCKTRLRKSVHTI